VIARRAHALGGGDAVVSVEARDVVEVEFAVRVEHLREGLASVRRLKDGSDVPVAYRGYVGGVGRWWWWWWQRCKLVRQGKEGVT